MMLEQPFRRNFLQHAMAVSGWMQQHNAQGGMDPRTLSMEIAVAGRPVRFYPQFVVERQAGTGFVATLQPGVCGFVGWLPYLGKDWAESRGKLAFKALAEQHGIATPAWGLGGVQPSGEYLVKKAESTFGRGMRGPFAAGTQVDVEDGEYWEHFVRGQVVKAWYWDGEPVVVEMIPMPAVTGDGKRMLAELALQALGPAAAAHALPEQLLAAQGLTLTSIPAHGQAVQLEYRYISPFSPANHTDHNVREQLRGSPLEAQLVRAGRVCLEAVPEAIRPCTAFSLDAVLDAGGQLWFLEVNCNPQLHPAIYAPMLDALFAPALHKA